MDGTRPFGTRAAIAGLGAGEIGRILRSALARRTRHAAPEAGPKSAAVLMVLFDPPGSGEPPGPPGLDAGPRVWLLRRPEAMRIHAGQVALPGGKRDATDATLLDTALREANEEIGLDPSAVDVLGAIDDVTTITSYVVTPYVAYLPRPFAFTPTPNPREVARVFSAPLAPFADGKTGLFANVSVEIDGENVWGATATMLRALASIVATELAQ